uniref:COesterase domain-containing protein n=1 Tax=Macrostomum lignano TaxID=282301 RepID=A0A1I8F5J8_9PLAT
RCSAVGSVTSSNVIDPRTLLVNDSGLQALSPAAGGLQKPVQCPPVPHARPVGGLRKVKDAILHPDTGEKIYRPFRMSGFVPYGTPIVVGLLLPHSRLWHTVFWQWLQPEPQRCSQTYCQQERQQGDSSVEISYRLSTGSTGQHAKRAANAKQRVYPKALKCSTKIAKWSAHQRLPLRGLYSIRRKLGRFYLYRCCLITASGDDLLGETKFSAPISTTALAGSRPGGHGCLWRSALPIAPKRLGARAPSYVAPGCKELYYNKGL